MTDQERDRLLTETNTAFRDALSTPAGRRMLLELMAYCHTLPTPLALGANHLLTHMQFKASAIELGKMRGVKGPAKGKVNG